MAGYSGTPLPRKLGIKEGSRIALVNAFPAFEDTLGELPAAAGIAPLEEGDLDVIVYFSIQHADLTNRLAGLKARLAFHGGLWVAWPKKVPGVPAAISEDAVREAGLAVGLVDNKVCAIDDTWSGLRFVYRRSDRPRD